jgi:predicted DNA-binding transcriptional regulator YafY
MSASRLPSRVVVFSYKNHRGEIATRTVIPLSFHFGTTPYYRKEQWLVRAWCCERRAQRVFAMNELQYWRSGKTAVPKK